MPSTKSVRLDPVQSFKVKKPSTVVISLSSQSSSDICRISWFSVDAIRCHRCLPSSREEQAEDAEHCAHRSRCMMSQLRSARVDKTSPPSKHDLLRGVVMMAHITAPPSQWQRSNSKKTDALMGRRGGGFPRDQRYCFRCAHASTRKSSCSVFVTESDERGDAGLRQTF